MTTQRRNSFAGRPRLTLDIVGEELERGAGDGHPLSPWHDLAGAKTEKRQSRRSSTGSISSRLFSPRSLGLVHPPTPRTISGLKIPKHSPRDGTPLRGGKGAAWGFGGKESGFGATSPRGNRPRSPGVSRRTRPLTPRSTIAAAERAAKKELLHCSRSTDDGLLPADHLTAEELDDLTLLEVIASRGAELEKERTARKRRNSIEAASALLSDLTGKKAASGFQFWTVDVAAKRQTRHETIACDPVLVNKLKEIRMTQRERIEREQEENDRQARALDDANTLIANAREMETKRQKRLRVKREKTAARKERKAMREEAEAAHLANKVQSRDPAQWIAKHTPAASNALGAIGAHASKVVATPVDHASRRWWTKIDSRLNDIVVHANRGRGVITALGPDGDGRIHVVFDGSVASDESKHRYYEHSWGKFVNISAKARAALQASRDGENGDEEGSPSSQTGGTWTGVGSTTVSKAQQMMVAFHAQREAMRQLDEKRTAKEFAKIEAAESAILLFKALKVAHPEWKTEKDHRGRGALSRAAMGGDDALVSIMLAAGADVDERDAAGATPLVHCIWDNHYDVAEILLKHNANVNVCTVRKNTALHFAKERNWPRLAALLVEHGASSLITNSLGLRPEDLQMPQAKLDADKKKARGARIKVKAGEEDLSNRSQLEIALAQAAKRRNRRGSLGAGLLMKRRDGSELSYGNQRRRRPKKKTRRGSIKRRQSSAFLSQQAEEEKDEESAGVASPGSASPQTTAALREPTTPPKPSKSVTALQAKQGRLVYSRRNSLSNTPRTAAGTPTTPAGDDTVHSKTVDWQHGTAQMSLMEKLTFFGAAHDSIQAEKHRATAALSTNKTLEMSPEAGRTAKESAAATRSKSGGVGGRAKQNWKSAKEKVSAKVNAAQVKDRERVDPLHRLASQQMARGEASLAMETHEERTARHESRARHRTRRNSAIDVNWLAEDVGKVLEIGTDDRPSSASDLLQYDDYNLQSPRGGESRLKQRRRNTTGLSELSRVGNELPGWSEGSAQQQQQQWQQKRNELPTRMRRKSIVVALPSQIASLAPKQVATVGRSVSDVQWPPRGDVSSGTNDEPYRRLPGVLPAVGIRVVVTPTSTTSDSKRSAPSTPISRPESKSSPVSRPESRASPSLPRMTSPLHQMLARAKISRRPHSPESRKSASTRWSGETSLSPHKYIIDVAPSQPGCLRYGVDGYCGFIGGKAVPIVPLTSTVHLMGRGGMMPWRFRATRCKDGSRIGSECERGAITLASGCPMRSKLLLEAQHGEVHAAAERARAAKAGMAKMSAKAKRNARSFATP